MIWKKKLNQQQIIQTINVAKTNFTGESIPEILEEESSEESAEEGRSKLTLFSTEDFNKFDDNAEAKNYQRVVSVEETLKSQKKEEESVKVEGEGQDNKLLVLEKQKNDKNEKSKVIKNEKEKKKSSKKPANKIYFKLNSFTKKLKKRQEGPKSFVFKNKLNLPKKSKSDFKTRKIVPFEIANNSNYSFIKDLKKDFNSYDCKNTQNLKINESYNLSFTNENSKNQNDTSKVNPNQKSGNKQNQIGEKISAIFPEIAQDSNSKNTRNSQGNFKEKMFNNPMTNLEGNFGYQDFGNLDNKKFTLNELMKLYQTGVDPSRHQINNINVINKIKGSIINFPENNQQKVIVPKQGESVDNFGKQIKLQIGSLRKDDKISRINKKINNLESNIIFLDHDESQGNAKNRNIFSNNQGKIKEDIHTNYPTIKISKIEDNSNKFDSNKIARNYVFKQELDNPQNSERIIPFPSKTSKKIKHKYKLKNKSNLGLARSPDIPKPNTSTLKKNKSRSIFHENKYSTSDIQNKIAERLQNQNDDFKIILNKFKKNNKKFFKTAKKSSGETNNQDLESVEYSNTLNPNKKSYSIKQSQKQMRKNSENLEEKHLKKRISVSQHVSDNFMKKVLEESSFGKKVRRVSPFTTRKSFKKKKKEKTSNSLEIDMQNKKRYFSSFFKTLISNEVDKFEGRPMHQASKSLVKSKKIIGTEEQPKKSLFINNINFKLEKNICSLSLNKNLSKSKSFENKKVRKKEINMKKKRMKNLGFGDSNLSKLNKTNYSKTQRNNKDASMNEDIIQSHKPKSTRFFGKLQSNYQQGAKKDRVFFTKKYSKQ